MIIALQIQIVIGTKCHNIREESLLKSWDLQQLRTEGMRMESALRGGTEIRGDNVNRLGKYSFKNMKQQLSSTGKSNIPKQRMPVSCFYCGEKTNNISTHCESCKGKDNKCSVCSKYGLLPAVCRHRKNIRNIYKDEHDEEPTKEEYKSYNVNLFVMTTSKSSPQPRLRSILKNDFHAQVIINNVLDRVLADTGAKVSVCGTVQVKKWGLLNKMTEVNVKIKPYRSDLIPVHRTRRCAVTFGATTLPVEWHISGSCEPILSGTASMQLGIIDFKAATNTYKPICMIDPQTEPWNRQRLQDILLDFKENFEGLGRRRGYEVKLHIDKGIKPIATPPCFTPYHLQERVQKLLDKMITNDVIEELPTNEPAHWISCSVIAPKRNVRMTLDARNINKLFNRQIQRQEDIKAKLSGSQIFSKLDFKNAFWQIQLQPDSRNITTFHCNGKLYRYKVLTMGLKPAQGELNAALRPIFAHIKNVHLIHDDVVIATSTTEDHEIALKLVMEAISNSSLTLNPTKCIFGAKEIEFWGLLIGSDGVRPNPAKVAALDHITPPNKSFLCMMLNSSRDF